MLRDELQNSPWAKHGKRLYILVDPMLGDPFPDASGSKVPLPIIHSGLHASQRPYLLPSNRRGKLLAASVELASLEAQRLRDDMPGARTLCGWLFTSIASDRVAEHLAAQALLPSLEGTRLLRYWDPRVMDLLHDLLTPSQASGLRGPANGWYWVARNGRLQNLSSPDPDNRWKPSLKLSLSDEQFAVLQQMPTINLTLDILQDQGHDLAQPSPLQLARHLRSGRHVWGIESEREQVIYALHCVLVGEQFDRIPEVHHAMLSAFTQGRSVIDALEQFDDAYWQNHGKALSGRIEA